MTPASEQGEGKLRLRSATICGPAFRSRDFRSEGSLLLGGYWQNITFVGINTCPAANFAKGSVRHGQIFDYMFNNPGIGTCGTRSLFPTGRDDLLFSSHLIREGRPVVHVCRGGEADPRAVYNEPGSARKG